MTQGPAETGEAAAGGPVYIDPKLVSLLQPRSFAADQYRVLRHLIEERRSEGLGVIGITSPGPEDGKTLTAINLAACLAEGAGSRILLVDADLRRPSVLPRLGLESRSPKGLGDVVSDEKVQLESAVRRYGRSNFFLMPPGRPRSSSYEILKSARLTTLFTECRRAFDLVIIDTPPILAFPDFRLIEKVVDASILVVAAHKTPAESIDEAVKLLDPAKALGVVFNQADLGSRYYRGAYEDAPGARRG